MFESGHESVLKLPEALATRLVADFAKFSNGAAVPAYRYKIDETQSFYTDFRKVAMVSTAATRSAASGSDRRAKRV